MISPDVVAMLRDLDSAASLRRVPYLLVGAAARVLLCDEVLSIDGRATKDWDFGVRVEDWPQFDALREALLATSFRPDPAEHRLRHVSGLRVDLVPFGGPEGADRCVEWPRSRFRMDVTGFREADEDGREIELADGLSVRVVTLRGLLVLKAIAYEDRRGHGIEHDLGDLDFILRHADRLLEESRVFDLAGDALRAGRLEYVDAAAYCLGRDVGRGFGHRAVTKALETVAARLEDPDSSEVRRLNRHDVGGGSGVAEARETAARWRALLLGIVDARRGG